jgi:cell division protein ZapA
MMVKSAPPGDAPVMLDVSLLGRDYKVACKEAERAQLMDAVGFLDRRMREIRDAGKIAGSERIAVMAALNIAHDLLRARSDARAPKGDAAAPAIDDTAARRRIAAMHAAIDQALAGREAEPERP